MTSYISFGGRYARRYYLWSFWSKTVDTEVPASERKTKAVVSEVVQGQRGVDAHRGSCVAERAVWAHRAARQAAGKHVRNAHARRRRHEQHGPKHGGDGLAHVYYAFSLKGAWRHRESKSGGGRGESDDGALQGLPQGFERRICDCEPEAQAAAVSLHERSQYPGG